MRVSPLCALPQTADVSAFPVTYLMRMSKQTSGPARRLIGKNVPVARTPKLWGKDRFVSDWRAPVQPVGASHIFCSGRAKSLWSRCVPKSGEFCPTFQRAFSEQHFQVRILAPQRTSPVSLAHFRLAKIARHFRELAGRFRSLQRNFLAFSQFPTNFCTPVSSRDFSISKFCCVRLGSKPLRLVRDTARLGLSFDVNAPSKLRAYRHRNTRYQCSSHRPKQSQQRRRIQNGVQAQLLAQAPSAA